MLFQEKDDCGLLRPGGRGSKLAAPPSLFARRRTWSARWRRAWGWGAPTGAPQLARSLRASQDMSVTLMTILSSFNGLPDRAPVAAGQEARAGGQGLPGAILNDAVAAGEIA